MSVNVVLINTKIVTRSGIVGEIIFDGVDGNMGTRGGVQGKIFAGSGVTF